MSEMKPEDRREKILADSIVEVARAVGSGYQHQPNEPTIFTTKYRCARCEEKFTGPSGVGATVRTAIIMVAAHPDETYYQPGNGIGIGRFNAHFCADGGYGLGELIGADPEVKRGCGEGRNEKRLHRGLLHPTRHSLPTVVISSPASPLARLERRLRRRPVTRASATSNHAADRLLVRRLGHRLSSVCPLWRVGGTSDEKVQRSSD